MSQPKYAKKRDESEAAIIKALRDHGYTVEQDGEVDLLVRHCTWKKNVWTKGEAKTRRTQGEFKPRSDQFEQAQYCIRHCVPYWFSIGDALSYLESFATEHKLKLGTNPR